MSKFTKILLGTGLVLIVYGYLCRVADLYFFWESKHIGIAVLFIGLINVLSERIKAKKEENKKTLYEKIGLGVISFILITQILFSAIITFTDAYKVAKSYLINSNQLKNEIGNVRGFGLIPTGSVQKTKDSKGETGNATISLIVKGEKKNRDITIFVTKDADSSDWKVEAVE